MRDRPFASCCAIFAAASRRTCVIVSAVLGAVACSVSTQYGVKFLVDALSAGPAQRRAYGSHSRSSCR